jgi:DNA processing protein
MLGIGTGPDVFAMPGSPADPRARGTNNLIHQEAILRETIFDISNVINPGPRIHVSPVAQGFGALDQIISVTDDAETTKVRG